MTDETELKLEMTMEGARALEEASLFPGSSSTIEQRSTYFDTSNGLLAKAGLSLRIRQSKSIRVQTIKVCGASASGLFVRSEWEQTVDRDEPIVDDTTPIPSLLREKVNEIGPVFQVYIDRRIWTVQDGETLIEIALDRGKVVAGDRTSPICELELELLSGHSSALFDWARKINSVVPARLGVLSKAERGYRLRGEIVDSVKSAPIMLNKDFSVNLAFQKISSANLWQFRMNETLLESQNPRALHQARVSLRRLLSAITIFKPVLMNDELLMIRSNLRWLTSELGIARNLDVLVEQTTNQPLLEKLEAARIDAYAKVLKVLASKRARSFMIDLAEWIEDSDGLSNIGECKAKTQPLEIFACDVLRRSGKKLRKVGSIAELNDEQRHQIRKNAKKMRYASEFFASLFDSKDEKRRHKRFIKELERLQNALGALNDIAMIPAVLHQIGVGDSWEAERLLSPDKKGKLLGAAVEAHENLSDTKRFW